MQSIPVQAPKYIGVLVGLATHAAVKAHTPMCRYRPVLRTLATTGAAIAASAVTAYIGKGF